MFDYKIGFRSSGRTIKKHESLSKREIRFQYYCASISLQKLLETIVRTTNLCLLIT